MKSVPAFILLFILAACRQSSNKNTLLPSRVYQYTQIDTATMAVKEAVYVPVYSHIYSESGNTIINLATTLSVRNTSFTDSFYVTGVTYYGSQGEVLKNYLSKTLVVAPMCSIEFVVERDETRGGAGANFVVHWMAKAAVAPPLIQAVFNETSTGISFIANGVNMQ